VNAARPAGLRAVSDSMVRLVGLAPTLPVSRPAPVCLLSLGARVGSYGPLPMPRGKLIISLLRPYRVKRVRARPHVSGSSRPVPTTHENSRRDHAEIAVVIQHSPLASPQNRRCSKHISWWARPRLVTLGGDSLPLAPADCYRELTTAPLYARGGRSDLVPPSMPVAFVAASMRPCRVARRAACARAALATSSWSRMNRVFRFSIRLRSSF